jgi:sulfoxide reductase heme-binding subunit YedZ
MLELPDHSSAPIARAVPRRVRRGPVYQGLPRPVRVLTWLATSAILAIVIATTLPGALRLLGATADFAPGKLAWYGVRATGFLAYFAVAGSVIYGLLLSTRLLDAIAHRPVTFALHKDLALVGLGLSALHGLMLLGDRTYAFTLTAIVVPFASPYAPVAVAVGQLAFCLVAVVTGSFYLRRQIGQRAWRLIHYLTFLGFVGVTAHGIAAGSDTAAPLARWAYVLPIAAIAFFLAYRVVVSIAARRDRARTEKMAVQRFE